MNVIARLCTNRPIVGWFLVALLSVPPISGFLGARLVQSSVDGWVSPEALASLREVEETFECGSPVALVFQCEDFFRPDRVRTLHRSVGSSGRWRYRRSTLSLPVSSDRSHR